MWFLGYTCLKPNVNSNIILTTNDSIIDHITYKWDNKYRNESTDFRQFDRFGVPNRSLTGYICTLPVNNLTIT